MTRPRKLAVAAAALALLALAATGAWILTGVPGIMAPAVDKSRYPVTGIDISAHNGAINFERVAASGVDFAYIKATEGATFRDRAFADNHRRASKAGLAVGAYHFFRFDTPGHMQAINLLQAVRGRRLDLPLAIDVEEWTNPGDQPPHAILSRLWEMTDYLEAHGHRVVIYTNKDGLRDIFGGSPRHLPLWIASFGSPDTAGAPWTLWQHTHRGSIDGIDGNVDLNTFNGPRSQWLEWMSGGAHAAQ